MKRIFCARLTLLACSIVIFIIFSETVLHFLGSIYYNDISYHPDFQYTFIKNLNRTKPFTTHTSELITDSRGFRSKEIAYDKPNMLPNIKRVLVLGDSVTANVAVPTEYMFTTVLEKNLNTQSREWEVINRGIEGWGTDNEYLYLLKEGYKYSPDTVIIEFTVGNDFFDVYNKNITFLRNGNLTVNPEFEPPSQFQKVRLFLNQYSALYNLVADFYKSHKNPKGEWQGFISEGYTDRFFSAFNETVMLLEAMNAFAHERQMDLIVVIYADPRQMNKEYYTWWNNRNKNYIPFEELDKPIAILKTHFQQHNITFVDTSTSINQLSDYAAIDDGHMSIIGSKKMADAIAAFITSRHK